jgi:hypothetical protein
VTSTARAILGRTHKTSNCLAQPKQRHFSSALSTDCYDSNCDKMSNAELATSYAALILADDGVDITVSLACSVKCRA